MQALSKRWPLFVVVLLVVGMFPVLSCGGESKSEEAAPGATARVTINAADETIGVTDTEIKLGTHFPLSQNPAAAWAPIAYGMRAFFDYINLQGGVYGRKITLSSAMTTTTQRTRWRW